MFIMQVNYGSVVTLSITVLCMLVTGLAFTPMRSKSREALRIWHIQPCHPAPPPLA